MVHLHLTVSESCNRTYMLGNGIEWWEKGVRSGHHGLDWVVIPVSGALFGFCIDRSEKGV